MDIEHGLAVLERSAQKAKWRDDFALYEAQMRDLLADELRYGPSEQTRRDRSRILENLNKLALQHVGVSFNRLCESETLSQPSQALPTDSLKLIIRYTQNNKKRKYQAIVSARLTVKQLLPMMIKSLKLPTQGATGFEIRYQLALQEGQDFLPLDIDKTLSEQSIENEAVLFITRIGG